MDVPSWMILALLSGFIMAGVNLVNKYVLTKLVRKAIVPVLMLGFVGLPAGAAATRLAAILIIFAGIILIA